MPFPIFGGLPQFFDNNGNPLNAGRLYVYLEGTMTPATVYKNVALSTPHANPIVLQADGRPDAPIIADDGAQLKFELRTSLATGEVLLMTSDGIRVPNGKRLLADDGSVSLPAYSFALDPDTGTYRGADNALHIATGGTERAIFNLNGLTVRQAIAAGDGVVGSPGYRFDSDGDTGMYRAGANQLGFSAAGNLGLWIDGNNSVRIGTGGAVSMPFGIPDGVVAPAAVVGVAFIYVDSADGDLKVRFGDGMTKTIVTDT